MDVDGMVPREIDDRGRDNLAVGDHDMEVGLNVSDRLERGLIFADTLGLKDGDGALEGEPFDRRGRQFSTPAGRSVRLGDDQLDGMARAEKAGERGQGGLRAAEKDCAHQDLLFSA